MIQRFFQTSTILWFLIFPSLAMSIDYSPWLGEMLVFDWRNTLLYQNYSEIDSDNHLKNDSANDLFLTTSLSTSVLDFGLQIEATQAFTHRQQGSLDNLGATLKYVYWDDVAGDPFSITLGLSLIQAFRWSVHDISAFHHGKAESELFVSVGKETACLDEWTYRWSSTAALGLADVGSPWLRFNWEYEYKWPEEDVWKVFCHTLFGLGDKSLNQYHFNGYGAVEHQSVDLGVSYTYLSNYLGKICFHYSRRLYAKNFPANTNLFLIEIFYDFGVDRLSIFK